MINVEITKNNGAENDMNLIRRFTKKIRNSGILPRVRSIRYHNRKTSKYVKKQETLKSISKKAEIQRLIKLGKMPENKLR
ncbi:MAG: 30S ribosomal protein S21 [Candidatus Pacebacteria bacterium]|nr:30S ribosomal protein S21 [Candidatus Paceibacterota bacterium]